MLAVSYRSAVQRYRRDDPKRARSKMWVEADLEKPDLAGRWLAKENAEKRVVGWPVIR